MLSPADMLILGAAALMFFGPDQLPKVARRAGQVVRDVQSSSQSFIREMERAADEPDAPKPDWASMHVDYNDTAPAGRHAAPENGTVMMPATHDLQAPSASAVAETASHAAVEPPPARYSDWADSAPEEEDPGPPPRHMAPDEPHAATSLDAPAPAGPSPAAPSPSPATKPDPNPTAPEWSI